MDNDIQQIIDKNGWLKDPTVNSGLHNLLDMFGIIAQEFRNMNKELKTIGMNVELIAGSMP
jgi:hypothetical protein